MTPVAAPLQRLFPNSPQEPPHEVAISILDQVKDLDLVQMRKVSKAWNHLLSDERFFNRIMRGTCIRAVFTAIPKIRDYFHRDHTFVELARIQAQYDVAAAIKTTTLMNDPDHSENALTEIVAIVVHDHVSSAKAIAQTIKKQSHRDPALYWIVKFVAQSDIPDAKATASM